MEGPKGPHLFRSSQSSSDFNFDFALQMSPLLPKEMPARAETETAFRSAATPVAPYQFNSITTAVAGLDSTDVQTWTAKEVASWMWQNGVEESVIERFEAHDITGAVLMDLQFEDLKELEIQSFGKRHHLWNQICALRGNEGRISPMHTPFQDISRPVTENRHRGSGNCDHNSGSDECFTPITPGGGKKRRGRKHRNKMDDVVTPAESVSIVAIEQLLPKPHKCAKGERCNKWKKQQRQLARLQQEHGFPISPEKGGHIFVAGDPGNAASAHRVVENVYRPTSETVPSVVASSDLLGPGQLPEFALHEEMLRNLELRDPQENVKQFLSLQGIDPPHMQPMPVESPPTPPLELFPPLHPPEFTPAPHSNLKTLPKLSIPRSASANPYTTLSAQPNHTAFYNPQSAFSPCRTAVSPGGLYRFGTPSSEMDVPITAVPIGPVSRDVSQSVPPNMQYRDPVARPMTRNDFQRRPSVGLPPLNEGEVFSPIDDASTLNESRFSGDLDDTSSIKKALQKSTGFQYEGVNHAGWMKKRRTKLLRHEWQDQHFRLTGTRLAMHSNELPSATALDVIDVDDYAVACSSIASNKLAAKLKSLKLAGKAKDGSGPDPAAFSFQLVPTGPAGEKDERVLRKAVAQGKTHHFAVKTRDERIDWMRELMLAKALKAKGEGYEVQVNGTAV